MSLAEKKLATSSERMALENLVSNGEIRRGDTKRVKRLLKKELLIDALIALPDTSPAKLPLLALLDWLESIEQEADFHRGT